MAIAALRLPGLRRVVPAGHGEVLRLLAKRNTDIGVERKRTICRIHALLVDLRAGGLAKEINASDVDRFLEQVHPRTPVEQLRVDLVVKLLADVRRLDLALKESHRRLRSAVAATGTSLTDIYAIGPVLAATIIGHSGDISRFENRDRYATLTAGPGGQAGTLRQRGRTHIAAPGSSTRSLPDPPTNATTTSLQRARTHIELRS